jgi:hypothetical protein
VKSERRTAEDDLGGAFEERARRVLPVGDEGVDLRRIEQLPLDDLKDGR